MFIIDDILLSPIKGLLWLSKKINEIVESETSSASKIKEKLMQLRLQFEMDEITIEEYKKEEKVLLARLDAIQRRGEVK